MSDTDEHEFHIEGETLQTEAISHPQSSEDDETKCKLQQATLDNKLLRDAGFPVDEMDEAERREILWALRESMPDTDHKNPAASMSSNSKVQRKEVKPEEEFLPEDPLQKVVDTTDDDVGQACDSTTSAAPSRSTKARTTRKKQQPDASALSETELTSVLHTRRSRRPQKKLTDGGSDTSEKSEDGDGLGEDLKTRSLKKLTAKQREMMKLSPRQKEQCQSRFKDLLNKTTLSLSQQGTSSQGSHLSPVKEGIQERDEAAQASQDLFGVQQSDEEEPLEIQPTPPVEQIQSDNSASSPAGAVDKPASQKSKPVKRNHEEKKKKTRTPSPVQIQSEDSSSINEMGGGTQESVVQDQRLQPEELETQSLEDYVVLRVEEGEEEEEEVVMVTDGDLAKEKLDDRRSSPVYSVQVTKSSCSSPQPCKNDRQIEGISPSKLPIEDEDENDNRPLLHDNWFSWPHVPPACHLQRSYRNSSRKRKEPPTGTSSYLCPKSVSPEQHSKVILQMLDTYLLRFTRMQCRFKKLAWGKPVHTGLHLPGTLDMRKRGGPTFCFNLDEDDDFENGQPPSKKLAAGDDVQRKRNLGLFRNKQGSTRVVVVTREEKVRDDPGSAGVSAEAQSVYDAETQPMESDDELPDIQLSTKTAEKGRSRSRNSEDKCIIPGSQGSQSSNSLLNEQGELYSTQVPHRKRRVEAGNQGLNLKEERRKRVCKTLQQSQRNVQSEDDDSNLEVPPLTRKRKQVSPPSDAENQVEVLNDDDDDDDDEVSFPQKKKIHVGEGFIHIASSGSIHKNTTHQTVVRPRPQRGNGSGNATGLHMRNLYNSGDSHFNPFRPSTSSKEHGKPGQVRPNLEEESDDSVQFVDPSSLKQTEERRIHVQPQSVQVGEATKFRDDIIGIASTSRSQSAEEAVQEEEEGAAEQELVECPLCSKPFPCSVIQQHASDCTGEEEPEVQQKLPEIERKAAVYSALQLKRRPLRGEINRDEFTCALCDMKLGGSSALMRHFEKCRQEHEKEEACGFSGDRLVQGKIGIDATKTRSAESAWMHSYKIPRKEKDGVKRKSVEVQLAPEEEMDEVIQEYSDDSDKDPDFALTKDDKRQEREDVKEDDAMNEENGASTNTFIHISNPKKQRRRATKGKDKE
ncbi:uncharacterized protein [Littorina saxatilis]|uniref:UBZ4-type domain-containing protein n=1 Tax=Littorina saxatilis TaxID=31220 RepID=A0AAN9BPJ7_9CAEN